MADCLLWLGRSIAGFTLFCSEIQTLEDGVVMTTGKDSVGDGAGVVAL